MVESLLTLFNISAFSLLLTVEEIYRTYHFGPGAVIELFEKHLGQAYLHQPPPESMLEKTILGQMERIEQLEKQIERLQEELRRERHHNHRLKKRVSELEESQSLPPKDSHNSHLPPSKDLSSRRRTKSLRLPSRLKPGGQPGHPGQTLRLAENPDRVIRHSPQQCLDCQASFLSEANQKQKQWAEPMKWLLQEMKEAVDEAMTERRKQLTTEQGRDFD